MDRETFNAKMKEQIPGCTDAELSKWHEFADENADHGQFVDFVNEPDKETAVSHWLDTLYAGMVLVGRKYGANIARQICSLSSQSDCLYPYEMQGAAKYLKRGGNIDEVGILAVEGQFDDAKGPVFPKPADVENIPKLKKGRSHER